MIIEIWTKEQYAGNEEQGFIARMAHTGLVVNAARLSRLYRVEGDFTGAEYMDMATGLLLDKITEHSALTPGGPALKNGWRVEVWLKDSVTDVVGESVKSAIAGAFGKEPTAVRFGHAYYVQCESETKLKQAVEKTLVNAIVNKFAVERTGK